MATLFLPEDAIFQILIWLPIRSLLQFKSVCRSWYDLINSSQFAQCHRISTTTKVDKNSKLGGTFICQQETPVPTAVFSLLSDEGFKELEDLGNHACIKDACAMDMADCLHGIICMYNKNTRDIVLWNPATRQCRVLPKSLDGNPKDGHNHRDFVGLGFDVESNDYKVIQVSSLEPKKYYVSPSGHTKGELRLGLDIPRKVEIYCLSSDSWRLIDSDFRTDCFSPPGGRSLNGIYFHQGLDYTAEPYKNVILSFDLSKEKYQRVIQTPDGNNFVKLASIGDKLACITTFEEGRPGFGKEYYMVWMLNDYDTGKEFWTELYRVDVRSPKLQDYDIIAVVRNGEVGLFCDRTLGLYKFITDEFEDLGFGEEIMMLWTLKTAVYQESLVSVDAPAKTISS